MKSYSLKRVFDLRDKITFDANADCTCIGSELVGEVVDDLAEYIGKFFPSVNLDVIYESVRHLAGKDLDLSVLQKLAWRLAGNAHVLRAGLPVHPWTAQREQEWVPLQITRVSPARNRNGEPGAHVYYLVLAGSPCPTQIVQHKKSNWFFVAARMMGFSKRNGRRPYSDPSQLVGLRLYGMLDPALGIHDPNFYEIRCPPSCMTHNKEILKVRLRDGKSCPNDYTHVCHECVIGWSECEAGTHRYTYYSAFCNECQSDNMFDPEQESRFCVNCTNKRMMSVRRRRPNG